MRRISTNQKAHSRQLRKNMTDVERLLWLKLRGRQLQGLRFRRQHPINNFIVDFVCLELKLIIELDGGQHANQSLYDQQRTDVLNGAVLKYGVFGIMTVLRIWKVCW